MAIKWLLLAVALTGCAVKPKFSVEEEIFRVDPCGQVIEQGDKNWNDPITCEVN